MDMLDREYIEFIAPGCIVCGGPRVCLGEIQAGQLLFRCQNCGQDSTELKGKVGHD